MILAVSRQLLCSIKAAYAVSKQLLCSIKLCWRRWC